MTNNTKLDENFEGAEKLRAWKYVIMLILEEHDIEVYIKDEVKELEGEEAKAKHNKDMIKLKRIISNFLKDYLIPQVSLKNTLK